MVGVILGNYQLVQKLGEGGMGAVYLGQHTLLGRRAAIKVLLPALSARPDIVNRFFHEARAVTSISDPGIVQVFDFGYHGDGSAFIVMEYLEGEALDRRLARVGRLPAAEALRLCRQIASSLAAAHAQHIIHRDLKPENIFLVPDAEVASGERSKILDFGIAKLSDDHPGKLKTSTGMLMGTPVYMSPEQCRGLAEVDHRSDIYSLGCVLFQLLTGRPPFEGEGPGDIISAHIREPAPVPSSRVPEIAPAVDALVLRCLAKAPAERFQTMAEVVAAVGQVLPQLPAGASSTAPPHHMLPTTAVPTPPPVPTTLGASAGQFTPPPAPRSSRSLMFWVAAGLVVGVAGIAITVVASRGPDRPQVTSRPTEPSMAPSAPGGAAAVPAEPPKPPETAAPASPGTPGNAPEGAAPSPSGAEPAKGPPDTAAVTAPDPAAAKSPTPAAAAQAKAPDGAAQTPGGAAAKSPSSAAAAQAKVPDGAAQTSGGAAAEPAKKRATPADGADANRKSMHRKRPGAGSGSPDPFGGARPAEPANTPPTAAAAAAAAKPAPNRCAKTAFAAVYNAAAPSKEALSAALGTLRECHAAGAINDADFAQTRDALVAKLMSKS